MVKRATSKQMSNDLPAITIVGEFTPCGDNVLYRMDGDLLYIVVDCSDEVKSNAPDSKSGKTKTIGSTNGFARTDGIMFSLNVNMK